MENQKPANVVHNAACSLNETLLGKWVLNYNIVVPADCAKSSLNQKLFGRLCQELDRYIKEGMDFAVRFGSSKHKARFPS